MRTKRTKTLGAALAALACFAASPSLAGSRGDFKYASNGSAVIITKYTGGGGDVTIPGTIKGLPVNVIGRRAFAECPGLTSVTIPDSVTSIDGYAFFCCSSLTSVRIGSGVISIGDDAFYSTGLTSLYIPDSVASIGKEAFENCSMTSVRLPASVTSIGDMAFGRCSRLTSITVDVNNTNFICSGDVLFDKSMATLLCFPAGLDGNYAVPDSVTSIGDHAFYCSGLTSVTMPDSVVSIGKGAFWNCSLTSVTIPDSVTSIGDQAFCLCRNLTSITVDADNTHYCTCAKGVLFDKSMSTLLCSPTSLEGNYAIPDSVTSIGGRAFSRCSALRNVTIPAGVSSIGDFAFTCCSDLKRVCFLGNMPTLGTGIFNSADDVKVYYRRGAKGWGKKCGGREAVAASSSKLWKD